MTISRLTLNKSVLWVLIGSFIHHENRLRKFDDLSIDLLIIIFITAKQLSLHVKSAKTSFKFHIMLPAFRTK